MNQIHLSNFNLQTTLLGGQTFAWVRPSDDAYYGVTQDRVIKLIVQGDYPNDYVLRWQTYPRKNDFAFIQKYFRLDVNYEAIISDIKHDDFVAEAIKVYPGLRILHQDFEHTLLSFIISSNNSVKSIKTRIDRMSFDLGETVRVDGNDFKLFPRTEIIADLKMDDLMQYGLGYRAKYLKASADKLLTERSSLESLLLKERDYISVRNKLLEFPGVGDKVADCVLVFGLGFDHVTPIDLWAKRVLVNLYGLSEKMSYADMNDWFMGRFSRSENRPASSIDSNARSFIETHPTGYAAWAGQFLFEWIRNHPQKAKFIRQ